MTQPEALRLADALDRYNAGVCSQAIYEDYSKAAAELRRQHVEIKLLRERHRGDNMEYTRILAQRNELLEALERSRGQWIHSVNAEQCLAAIAKAEKP